MKTTLPRLTAFIPLLAAIVFVQPVLGQPKVQLPKKVNIAPPGIATDKAVKFDYDIVYVRAPRRTDDKEAAWAEFSKPLNMEMGADLMLLHPDGTEEMLVSGKDGSVLDPFVSFDGQSVYYAKFIDTAHSGSDIYMIHVKSRKIVKLTDQTRTPNTGAADWSKVKLPYGVYNTGPCPLPGGKVVFTSNRNVYVPPRGYPRVAMQLFTMDDDGSNIDQIGYLNVAGALHPVIMKDGTIIFSSLESQGVHNGIMWAIWRMHPDGTNWSPVVSGLPEGGAPSGFHFQTQLSDESIIIERYYNQNQKGFGTLFKMPPVPATDVPAFGPGDKSDPRNRIEMLAPDGKHIQTIPFTPTGMKPITPWIHWADRPSPPSISDDPTSPRIGKVTHPSGAPENHLLVAWTLGPIGGSAGAVREFMTPRIIDSGLYLIKEGATTNEPGEMLLIKNDPKFNEQWPRALVPYKRIYGVAEPKKLVHENNGKLSKHLPEGTPYGLVGTSSNYKRESAPGGTVPMGSVTSIAKDWSLNWQLQGSDAGKYDNSEVHAIRIIAQEPLTPINNGSRKPLFGSHANERLRILGEIPLRKFIDGKQPLDPDGNPDTSFLAKIPANQPFTFQLLDKQGMTLTMAQTWHQVRPGEVRTDCGGCHAHSQKPTSFEATLAAKPDYAIFDLTQTTPLLTTKGSDQFSKKLDQDDETGLRFEKQIKNVEYTRDIRPILERSCTACHTQKSDKPAGDLVLDDHDKTFTAKLSNGDSAPMITDLPGPYVHLAGEAKNQMRGSKYIVKLQARRSLLVWKLFGKRLDNMEKEVGKKGQDAFRDEVEYAGGIMPPPEAVAGTFKGPDGRPIKVAPLSDEDRRTIIRWIDLGCPIDLDPQYKPEDPKSRSFGWMGDDQRPTLALTYPLAGANSALPRILIGMHDAYSGLDMETFRVTADFPLEGVAPGENLATKFKTRSQGVWELQLTAPPKELVKGKLTVAIKDRQGNESKIERTFLVAPGRE